MICNSPVSSSLLEVHVHVKIAKAELERLDDPEELHAVVVPRNDDTIQTREQAGELIHDKIICSWKYTISCTLVIILKVCHLGYKLKFIEHQYLHLCKIVFSPDQRVRKVAETIRGTLDMDLDFREVVIVATWQALGVSLRTRPRQAGSLWLQE